MNWLDALWRIVKKPAKDIVKTIILAVLDAATGAITAWEVSVGPDGREVGRRELSELPVALAELVPGGTLRAADNGPSEAPPWSVQVTRIVDAWRRGGRTATGALDEIYEIAKGRR